MSVIVENVVDQCKCADLNSTESDAKKAFSDLVEDHYLYRLSQDSQEEEGSNEKMQFVLPPEGEYSILDLTHNTPITDSLPILCR